MTNPRLDIRSRYRGVAFRAIEAVLREDPVLARVVQSWRSLEGLPGEFAPVTASAKPMIALAPIANPSEILGVDQTKINFGVRVFLATEGTCVDDLLALWEAVEDAIAAEKPFRGTTVRQHLCQVIHSDPEGPAGVMMLRPVAPAFEEVNYKTPPANLTFLSARGALACFFRRPANVVQFPA